MFSGVLNIVNIRHRILKCFKNRFHRLQGCHHQNHVTSQRRQPFQKINFVWDRLRKRWLVINGGFNQLKIVLTIGFAGRRRRKRRKFETIVNLIQTFSYGFKLLETPITKGLHCCSVLLQSVK